MAMPPTPLPLGGGVGGGVLYALNPLILLEITGNAHFEGAMLCFLLAGILFLQKNRLVPAAGFWALAVAGKLVPLLFLPIVWVHLGFRKGLRFLLFFSAFSALLFAPLLNLEILENTAGSLNLYFRQFAFNAGGYYLLKEAGKMLADPSVDVGRTLGPVLGVVVFLGVWVLALFTYPTAGFLSIIHKWFKLNYRCSLHQPHPHPLPQRGGGPDSAFLNDSKNEIRNCSEGKPPSPWGEGMGVGLLFASTLYLALATTVHPWYIALPFGLSLLTKWRYPVVWTAVAMLSYSHYAGGGFRENYWLIALEYLALLGFFVWEWLRAFQKRGPVAEAEKH